jgi:hypothetical protein
MKSNEYFDDVKQESDFAAEKQVTSTGSKHAVSSTLFSDPLQTVKHDKLTGQVIPAAGRVESPTTRATDNGCDHGGSKSHLELS